MKTTGFKQVSLLLSAATLMLGFSETGVQAQTVLSNTNEAIASSRPLEQIPTTIQAPNSPVIPSESNLEAISDPGASRGNQLATAKPTPGTTQTSASVLRTETSKTVAPVVAQSEGSTPGNTAPTTSPGNTRPDIIAPGTPSQTPGTLSPRQTTPGTFTPGTTTPGTTTPGTFTPGTTTPRQTTPGTFTPGTTTPGTTTPGTFTPGTTTPGTTTPGTFTPGTTTPGTVPPGTNTPDESPPPRTFTPGTGVITPGRPTSSGSSYFGIGGNIGLGDGDTAIGEGSFAILSKIGLTRNFSVRPSALIGDSVTILLPVTYDFSFGEGPTGELGFTAAPFLGVGAAISTSDDTSVDLLLTGGIDVPLSSQITATASVNASVTGNVGVGLLLGVGYNFRGF